MAKAAKVTLNVMAAGGVGFLAYDVMHPPLESLSAWCIVIILIATGLRWVWEAL